MASGGQQVRGSETEQVGGLSSDEDSDSDNETQVGAQSPPLTKQINSILKRYPEGGQILKELIQNADDAGATEVKFLIDPRQHSSDDVSFPKFERFQGAALYAWNNAVFKENDWASIGKINQSRKEEDPIKVGRFGLGFLSVFHLTDLPLIVSDKYLGVIDPHRYCVPSSDTNTAAGTRKKISKVFKHAGHASTFDGMFGLSRNTKSYNGTVFRFPLRQPQSGSQISDNSYTPEKVIEVLFESFREEAPFSLLFLKNIQSICLYEWNKCSNEPEYYFGIEVEKQSRESIEREKKVCKEAARLTASKDASSHIFIQVYGVTFIEKYKKDATEHHWLTVNVVGTSDHVLNKLKCELSVLPWVGLAVRLPNHIDCSASTTLPNSCDVPTALDLLSPRLSEKQVVIPWSVEDKKDNSAHAFCFLPLPECTALPVNIHGYFAVADNRRSIKWPAHDEKGKEAQWNKELVYKLVAPAYALLLGCRCELVKYSNTPLPKIGDNKDVTDAFSAWPLYPEVKNKNIWSEIVSPMLESAQHLPLLWTPAGGGKWVKPNEAYFLPQAVICPSIAVNLLIACNVPIVSLPHDVYETLTSSEALRELLSSREISAQKVRETLRSNPESCSYLSKPELYSVLEYILSDLTHSASYGELNGLPFLPIKGANKAVSFEKDADAKYVFPESSREAFGFLHGIDNMIIDPELPPDITNALIQVSEAGLFQLKLATPDVIASDLLAASVYTWSEEGNAKVWIPTFQHAIVVPLLKNLWNWIETTTPSSLEGLPIVPVCSKSSGMVQLYQHCKSFRFCTLPEKDSNLYSILVKLNFVVVDTSIAPHDHFPVASSLLVVEQLSSLDGCMPVESMSRNERDILRELFTRLCKEDVEKHQTCLKSLPIYLTGLDDVSKGTLISLVDEGSKVAFLPPNSSIVKLPRDMRYPINMLNPTNSINLLKSLGTKELTFSALCTQHMLPLAKECFIRTEDRQGEQILQWIFQVLQAQRELREEKLMEYLSTESLIKTRAGNRASPAQLYDPEDREFLELFDKTANVFPEKEYDAFQMILQNLGVKTWKGVTSTPQLLQPLLLERAWSLAETDLGDVPEGVVKRRGKFILETVSNLYDSLDATQVFQLLEVPFLLASARPSSYPNQLKWCSDHSQKYSITSVCFPKHENTSYAVENLVGSVLPILSSEYHTQLGISRIRADIGFRKITESDVVQQLTYLSSSDIQYNCTDVAEGMNTIVQSIYTYLLGTCEQPSLPGNCVWWRNTDPPQFFDPSKFVRQFPSGLHLEPYFYASQSSPLNRFQQLLGIKETIGSEDVLSILEQIQFACKNENRELDDNELKVCVTILDWLTECKDQYTLDGTILMPTAQRTLRAASECVFDDRELLQRAASTKSGKIKDWIFVSEKITSNVAQHFKVPPLNQKVAPSKQLAIAYTRAGQHESITQRIANIVRDYETNIDIFKELIQNADDAGATEVKFLLDWRKHPDRSLFTGELKHWQGPALIAYNNATFSDRDFEYICKLAGESKKTDPLKTGRFGVGFCATYHLTDLPSFVSRRYLTIFDPHIKYLIGRVSSEAPGMRVDLVESQDELKIYEDQFLPYDGIFNCDIFNLTNDGYQGTLFRFPYRSSYTSVASHISSHIYDQCQVQNLVSSLKKQQTELLLFLKNVRKVTLYEVNEDESLSQMSELFNIQCHSDSSERKSLLATSLPFGAYEMCCTEVTVNVTEEEPSQWMIASAHGCSTAMPKASGVKQDYEEGLLPFAEIALKVDTSSSVPIPTSTEGRLFCFLPLPIKSGLSFHVNGFFDVSKDRRTISASDDKTFGSLWNKHIATQVLSVAFINLLKHLAQQRPSTYEQRKADFLEAFYELWNFGNAPELVHIANCLHSQLTESLPSTNEKILWSEVREGEWFSPKEVFVLKDSSLETCEDIMKDAASLLIQYNYNIVEMPRHILECLGRSMQKSGRIIDYEKYCSELFFPKIAEIPADVRDRNILFLLRKISESSIQDQHTRYKWASNLIASTPCIPCESSDVLKTPNELIDCSNPLLKNLYDVQEGRFPSKILQQCSEAMHGLRHQGMSTQKLKLADLVDRARTVLQLANGNYEAAIERSHNLLFYLSKIYGMRYHIHTRLPEEAEEEKEVRQRLHNIPFLPVHSQPDSIQVPWHGGAETFISPSSGFAPEFTNLVFSQSAIVSLPEKVHMSNLLCLGIQQNEPKIDIVLRHLQCLVDSLPPELCKQTVSHIDTTMEAVYHFIGNHFASNPCHKLQLPNQCVWWPFADPPQFLSKERFVTKFPPGLHLEPFFYATQSSPLKKYQELFSVKETIDCEDALSILDKIKSTCEIQDRELDDDELKMCVSILEWLCKMDYVSDKTVLIPTAKGSLRPASQCIFDDRELFKRATAAIPGKTKDWYFVSGKITSEIAKFFAVPPLSQKVAPSKQLAIAYTKAGQHQSITKRIAHIVRDYETNIDIFKELIQNADDAGATEVKFLLDWRKHPDRSLFTGELKHWQGPALIAYNNATFSDQDFEHICEVAGESKKTDPLKTGRFGVGFCATYHLTDLPSFVSRRYLSIFDPHIKYLIGRVSSEAPGMRVDLVESQDELKIYEDQFLPYDGIFDCDIFNLTDDGYQGTLFRFPYRSSYTSDASDISKEMYGESMVRMLVRSLKQQQSEILLFLKNVQQVTLYEMKKNTQSLELFSIRCNGDHSERLSLIANPPRANDYSTSCTNLTVNVTDGKSSNWIISSAHGFSTPMPATSKVDQKGLLPFAEIALKVDATHSLLIPTSTEGRLFCFLPLPIKSSFTFHVNGFFNVGKDRRNLSTSDDKTFGTLWNKHIATDTLCVAFLNLLQNLAEQASLQCSDKKQQFLVAFYDLWRLGNAHGLVAECLCSQFKTKLPTSDAKLLWSEVKGGCWLSPTEIYVLADKHLKSDVDVMKDANSLLIQREYNVTEVPYFILSLLKKQLTESKRLFDYERYCTEVFFTSIDDTDPDLRDRNITFLLEKIGENMYITDHHYKWASTLLKSTPCIPCQSSPTLRKPTELIYCRNDLLANLYDVHEGRFPSETLVKSSAVMNGLMKLGMASLKLQLHDLQERASTVNQLDVSAASERSKHLLSYISRTYGKSRPYLTYGYAMSGRETEELDEVRKRLCDVPFLPVMAKPENVQVQWHGMNTSFVCPSKSYAPEHQDVVFTQGFVVSLPEGLQVNHDLRCLGIQDNKPSIDIVLNHLEHVINSLPNDLINEETTKFLDSAMKKVYNFINGELLSAARDTDQKATISGPDQSDETLEKIQTRLMRLKNVIWQEGHFLCVRQVFMHCSFSYYPYICELSGKNNKYEKLFRDVLKVKNEPSVEDLMHILVQINDDYAPPAPVPQQILDFIENLVKHLASKLDLRTNDSCDLSIFLPDDHCVMRPVSLLACDNVKLDWVKNMPVFEESFVGGTCFFINGCIPRERAIRLGVRPLLDAVLKEIEDDIEYGGTDYGQHEDLCDRLNSILKKYPPDVSIFQEFIQNADDAQATEISFILDHRQFPDDRLLNQKSSWKQLQHTPALCIFNNRKFKEEDIVGITKLGRGGKGESAELIGKFGIGFNVSYHVTDCPSFLSCDENGTPENLCAFDPMRKFVPRSSKKSPGKRWRVSKRLKDDLPHQFLPYLAEDLPLISEQNPQCLQNINQHGFVVFRLPLTRQKKTEQGTCKPKASNLCGAEFEPEDIVRLFDDFSKISRDMLLFLNNLKCISAFEIKKDGKYNHHFTTTAAIATPYLESHSLFSTHLKQCMEDIEAGKLPRRYSASHQVTIVHSETSAACTMSDGKTETQPGPTHSRSENWLVQRAISGPGVQLDILKAGFSQNLRPVGGIATLLTPNEHKYHLFCYLPMPIDSNLPVQINAHFLVDDSRKHLETIKQGGLEQWNLVLLREVVIPAYIELVLEAKSMVANEQSNREWYYKLYPGKADLSGELSEFPVLSFFYTKLLEKNLSVLLLESTGPNSQSKSEPVPWKSLKECLFCTRFECRETKQVASVASKLRQVFCILGLPITDAPYHIYQHCSQISEQYRSDGRIDPHKVCKHLKCVPLTGPLSATIKENIKIILQYCMVGCPRNKYHTLFTDGLFLVTSDGTLKRGCLFSSVFANLIPQRSADFIDCKLEYSDVGQKLSEGGIIRPLSLEYVAKYVDLPSSAEPSALDQSKLDLLELFWKLISQQSAQSSSGLQKQFVKLFDRKAVLPTKDKKLYPMCLARVVLNVTHSKSSSDLVSVMRKLGYSELDFSPINLQGREGDIQRHLLQDTTFTCVSGQEIVECFKVQTPKNCDVILRSEEVHSLLFCLSQVSRSELALVSPYLLKLRLFMTIGGTYVSLADSTQKFVMPPGMPMEGITDIQRQSTFVILVPPEPSWEELYERVIPKYSSACVSIETFYKELLIPNISHLKDCDIEKHVTYIVSNEKLFESVKSLLENTCFIKHNGKLHLVRSLYDPTVEYFRTFHSNDLLPQPWKESRLLPYMKTLGLITKVSSAMLLSQAKEIEVSLLPPNDIKRQSSTLLKNLIQLVEEHAEHKTLTPRFITFLSEIADVSFIVRFQGSLLETLLEYTRFKSRAISSSHPAPLLMKFSESVSHKEANLSCLCRTVLPEECDQLLYSKPAVVKLALCVEAPLTSRTVVENLVILSKQISGSCTRQHTQLSLQHNQKLTEIFVAHYACLDKMKLSLEQVTQLKEAMCILQEKGSLCRLVKPDQLVKILPAGICLEPFCYRVAPWMMACENFLRALDITEELTVDDYAAILAKIQKELATTEKRLVGSGFEAVASSAYNGLIQSLRQGGTLIPASIDTLFLLDESGELTEASKLYYNDVPWHASRLLQESDASKFRYLHTTPVDADGQKSIPPQLAVSKLSEVLVEKICEECTSSDVICPDEDFFFQGKRAESGRCEFVQAILATLRSEELFNGLCRLYYFDHQSTPPTKSFLSILHSLKELDVKCIDTVLKTVLQMHEQDIPGSETKLTCHLVGRRHLYISPHCDTFNEDLFWKQVSSSLMKFLKGEIRNELCIKSMFECQPSDISKVLDENQVTPFSMTDLKPEDRRTVGSVLPISELSPRDSIIVLNYRPGELVCYLSQDGVLSYATVLDTCPIVDDILQPTIKLKVSQSTTKANSLTPASKDSDDSEGKDNSDQEGTGSEHCSASDEDSRVKSNSYENSVVSKRDAESTPLDYEEYTEVVVSPLQVFKILSPSQEAWIWKQIETPYADPVLLASIPYTDLTALEDWINSLYHSKEVEQISGLMASMCTIRLIGHMHYQLVIQDHAPQLFTKAVMLIKTIVSEKDLPCTVINSKHVLHASMNTLVDMFWKLRLSPTSNESDPDSDDDIQLEIPVSILPPRASVYTASRAAMIPSSGTSSTLGLAPAAVGGLITQAQPVSGRNISTTQSAGGLPSTSSQPRPQQFTRARRGYRVPQQSRRSRFPNVQAAPVTVEPPKPATCMQSAGAWLEQAKADFKAAEVLITGGGVGGEENKFPALVCFLCHDSVEKSLKGAHYAYCGLRRDLVNSSNLVLLASSLAHCPEKMTAAFKECAMVMNQHENRSRFPNFQNPPCAPAVVYDVDSAKEAFSVVQHLFHEILKLDELKGFLGDMAQLPKLQFASTLKSMDSGEEWPSTWDPMDGDEFKLSILDPEGAEFEEYGRVASAFLQTLPNAEIKRIDRVQNKILWKKYRDRSKTMLEFNGGILRELLLFHGTRNNDPACVYKGDAGFDKRFSNHGMWGQGNYFAFNSSYSHGFAYRCRGDHRRKMFAAWVLTGVPFDSPTNSTLKMPPVRSTSESSENSICRRYDCVTGNTGGTRVYITYDNDLAYPAYLITYENNLAAL